MECRIYYGEYSLDHWVKLILKKNIVLPIYQRYFVWNEEKTKNLINAFKNNQFVPPVTIGYSIKNDVNSNLILDGQQRLTSILLSYLGIFPDKETYKKTLEKFADENDNPDDEDDDNLLDNVLEWSLKELTSKGKNKEEIINKLIEGNYKKIPSIDDNFLKTHYMGFSYLVPQTENTTELQRFYSTTFRNINIQGVALLPQESRESLYFLDESLEEYFNPLFAKKINVNDKKLDFVRYLSLLFQYDKCGNFNKLAYGYSKNMEKFYEEYIYSVVNYDETSIFKSFPLEFRNKGYKTIVEKIEENLKLLRTDLNFTSIIDADMYFFGLVYIVIFKNININEKKIYVINEKLIQSISEFRSDSNHSRNPGALKHLRKRITKSLEIFLEYCNE